MASVAESETDMTRAIVLYDKRRRFFSVHTYIHTYVHMYVRGLTTLMGFLGKMDIAVVALYI